MANALTELVKERIRQARIWRQNQCAKHGLNFEDDPTPDIADHKAPPSPPPQKVEIEVKAPAAQVEVKQPPVKVEPIKVEAKPANGNWKKWATAAALGLGTAGAGALIWDAWPDSDHNGTDPPPPKNRSSLFQELEDQGLHVWQGNGDS